MADTAGCGGCATPSGSRGSTREVQELIARGQRLVDAGRPPAGESLAWYVEASYVGDFPALAAARARA